MWILFFKSCSHYFPVNPLQPNISMHILHTVLYTSPKVLTRRICLRIKSFFFGDHSLYSHDLNVWFRADIVRRNRILVTLRGSKIHFCYCMASDVLICFRVLILKKKMVHIILVFSDSTVCLFVCFFFYMNLSVQVLTSRLKLWLWMETKQNKQFG